MPNRFYSSTSVTTSLSGTVGPSTTSITLASTVGMPGSLPYTLIIDPDTLVEEIVTVTGASGTTLTVTRGEDGTTGQAHTAGAVVVHGVSARDFREPQAHMDLTANVHGVSGTLANAASVAALSASVSGSLGGKVDKSTLAGKGYLVTATAGATPVGLAPGADGTVLMADSSATNGVKYATSPGIELLGMTVANPATTASAATASGSFGNLSGALGSVTFTAPSSGRVLVKFSVYVNLPGDSSSGRASALCLTNAGGTKITGTDIAVGPGGYVSHYCWVQTGLTPGASVTYSVGATPASGFVFTCMFGQSVGSFGGSSPTVPPGPAIIQVWAA